MNQIRFYVRCVKRAASDTAAFFDFHRVRAYANVIIPAILTFAVYWKTSEKAAFLSEVFSYGALVVGSLTWALVVFIAKFVTAPYHVKLDDLIKPSFELLFEQGGSFIQRHYPGTLYRVGVKNLSISRSIESVAVQLTDIQPNPPSFLPLPLHLMNDNTNDGQHQKSFRLDPHQTQFIDLIDIYDMPSGKQFFIKHIVKNIKEQIVGPESILMVTVSGTDCTPASRSFKITLENSDYKLTAAG